MKKISSRSIWLFFVSYLIRLSIIPIIVELYLISLLPDVYEEVSTYSAGGIVSSVVAVITLWIFFSLLWAILTQRLFRYALTDQYFQKDLGVLYKKSITIPYENIQNIEITRPLLSQILGLSEIHIETSGRHSLSEGRLPGLPKAEALSLRDELVRRSHSAKLA